MPMPLDPQVRILLDQMEAAGQPPLQDLSPADGRAAMANLAALGQFPDHRAETEDRRIPGPAGEIPIRVYRPSAPQPLPVVVYFHGGGWVIGGIETHDSICQQIATRVPA